MLYYFAILYYYDCVLFRQEEFVVQEIIKKWHPRHSQMIDDVSIAYRRLEGWLKKNVAKPDESTGKSNNSNSNKV